MQAVIRQMRSSQIEALVAVLGASATFMSVLHAEGGFTVPAVLICSADIGETDASVLGFDQGAGIRAAISHLREQGIDSFMHVTGDLDFDDATVRLNAYLAECKKAGVAGAWYNSNGWSARSGYAAGKRIAANLPKGIIAGNDTLAIGIMRALSEEGMHAGRDYAIVGFDNNATSNFLQVSLSSVNQDFELMSRRIFTEVFSLVDGGEPRIEFLETPLIVRESSQLAPR